LLFRSFTFDYLSRLLSFAVREHRMMFVNIALALVLVFLDLAAIASVMPLSTLAAGGEIPKDSVWAKAFQAAGIGITFSSLLLYFVVLFAFRLITSFLNLATGIYLGKRVQADLSSRAFEMLVKDMSLREIDSKSAGHFISLAGDETARAGAIITSLNQLLAVTLLAGAYLATIFYFLPPLGVAVVVFLVIAFAGLQGTMHRSQMLSTRQLGEAKVAHSVFLDALNGLRSVRALSAESFVTSKYDAIIRRYTRTHFQIDILGYVARLGPALVVLVCLGLATGAGYLDVSGPAQLALVATALALLLRFFPAAGQVLTYVMRLLADLRGASDVTHLLDPKAPILQSRRGVVLEGELKHMELRAVCFAYKPGRPVLQGFSATLRSGRSYALVGASGSGKTTVLDLLLGFYSPDSGGVFANGIAVLELDGALLRSRIILVGQQVSIMNDTVANNVRFGANATDAEVVAACEVACIDEYIKTLPQGYETVLSFQGSNLSGGQRQRIAIARGLLRNPSLLLLDESTTGLDARTRDQLTQNILSLYKERIVVFATHDRELVSKVDEVISLPTPARPVEIPTEAKDATLT
jgi:ABC-type bacteriocin/lantibiotic exporter with double-glycine peptidase domain